MGREWGAHLPWLQVIGRPSASDGGRRFIPPSGFVAGVYSQTDRVGGGVHKAPANVALNEVFDLRHDIDDLNHAELNCQGINCIRSFPGRGIRVFARGRSPRKD